MSWVSIVPGLYYAVGTRHILSKWPEEDYDVVYPQNMRFHNEASTGMFGFLGLQGGLIQDQKVDELRHSTRLPFELQMRRNSASRSIRQDVEMLLRIRWYNLSGIDDVLHDSSIPLVGTADFTHVDYQDMYPLNEAHSGTILLAEAPEETPAPYTTPADHPTFFAILEPLDPDYGPLQAVQLCWKAKLYPRGGTSWRMLREWFDPVNPQGVQLGMIDGTNAFQELTYYPQATPVLPLPGGPIIFNPRPIGRNRMP